MLEIFSKSFRSFQLGPASWTVCINILAKLRVLPSDLHWTQDGMLTSCYLATFDVCRLDNPPDLDENCVSKCIDRLS